MNRIKIGFFFIVVYLAIALPFAVIGGVLLEKKGLWIGFLGSILCVGSVMVFSENLMGYIFRRDKKIFKGLSRTLEIVESEFGGVSPRLIVFSDPAPDALALRSIGGRGTIFISQGMIGLLSEKELQAILKECMSRLSQPGVALQGLCFTVVHFFLAIAPQGWVGLVFSGNDISRRGKYLLSPISAIGFLILFPIIRFFLKFGSLSLSKVMAKEDQGDYWQAIQKIVQAVQVLGLLEKRRVFSILFPL